MKVLAVLVLIVASIVGVLWGLGDVFQNHLHILAAMPTGGFGRTVALGVVFLLMGIALGCFAALCGLVLFFIVAGLIINVAEPIAEMLPSPAWLRGMRRS